MRFFNLILILAFILYLFFNTVLKNELLDTQRRMHPLIAEFSNQNYYQSKLKTDYSHSFEVEPLKIINIKISPEFSINSGEQI